MGQKLRIAGWVATGMVTGALIMTSVQTWARGGAVGLPFAELQELATVFEHIKNSYVEPVDEKKLIQDAIAGMVSGLDPHSQYYNAKEYEEFRTATSGEFVGIGVEISAEDGAIKVVSPIDDTPAYKAGLRAGDLIVRINATNARGMTTTEAMKLIRGQSGTTVRLSIFRKDENRTFGVSITRAAIKTQSVKSKMIAPGYGWLRLQQFQERSLEDVVKHVTLLYKAEPNMKGLVLDLRSDPGGLLDVAVGVSAIFLPKDAVVVSTNGQLPDSKMKYIAHPSMYQRGGQDPLQRLPVAVKSVPLVVLVNEGSASASEIVAGALQDYKRATIMGGQTYGKGSVQTVRPLSQNTAVKITTARYYTPKGRAIQAAGVIPDIFVDDTAEGNPFAALRSREADLRGHLKGQGEKGDAEPQWNEAEENARLDALQKAEEEARKKMADRIIPEFGSDKDFQLQQALNRLQGKSVLASTTQKARTAEELQAMNNNSDKTNK